MEGFYILVVMAYFSIGASAQESDQPVLGTCLCNYTEGGSSFLTNKNCDMSRTCTVTEGPQQSGIRSYLGCLLEYGPTRGPDIWEVVQSCIPDNFNFGKYCISTDEDKYNDPYIVKVLRNSFTICCFTDNCNDEALFHKVKADLNYVRPSSSVQETTPSSMPSSPPLYAVVSISVLSVALFLVVLASVFLVLLFYRSFYMSAKRQDKKADSTIKSIDSSSYQEKSLNEFLEYSGSGAGQPLLVHRSIAGLISLHELIGKGRYGRVYKGSYKLDEVAVKVFHTVEKVSWSHEVDIYQTCLFCHPNILRFIASDSKDSGDQVELWLITEYCEYGSLYDLLIQRTFDKQTMLHLAYTAICGLDHLHSEIFGHEAKPAIVHRDLKSRNILVKADFTCCIGDLGLALRYDRGKDEVEDPPSKRVGTKRYLAPEIIDESISFKQFDLFKRADIYSFGLILWEIALRGKVDDTAEEYLMPYQNMVPMDPSFEDMKKVVVVEKKRPPFPDKWNQSEVFRNMKKLIQQCWLHDSDARLTSQRLKRNLFNLQQSSTDKKENEHSSGSK